MRVAWIHNYENKINLSSGVFMYQIYDFLNLNNSLVKIDLINIGSINNPFVLLLKLKKYRSILKDYDILHAQYGSGTGFFTSLFNGKKILSLRGSDWYFYPSPRILERLHSWLGCKLSRWSIPQYDQIVVMSERMAKEVGAIFPTAKVKVIPDGINLTKFYPVGTKGQLFRVLFSSVDLKNRLKRYELAQEAFSIFHSKFPDTELEFMNGVPHDSVNNFINSGHVILLTSTHEGWPNIIKEGLACNVPFVSTDVSDLRTIAQLTKSCFVCDDNPESLALGLEKSYLLNSDENICHLSLKFDIRVVAEKLSEMYINLNSR